jgi:hypothetical protein
MSDQQLSLFDFDQPNQINSQQVNLIDQENNLQIYLSALSSGLLKNQQSELIKILANYSDSVSIARGLGDSRLVRNLNLIKKTDKTDLPQIIPQGDCIFVGKEEIGYLQILYKSPLPGELQAKLAIESIIYRFLEYLQKLLKIIVLSETDFHVKIFVPKTKYKFTVEDSWQNFIKNVAFSIYGDPKNQLPGLAQTFIAMLNTVTLASNDYGFSTLKVPIVNKEQASILAGWYLAVIRDLHNKQISQSRYIQSIKTELTSSNLTEKERDSKEKLLEKKQKEHLDKSKKYDEYFEKTFAKLLDEQEELCQKSTEVEKNKLQNLIDYKKYLFAQYKNPFLFIEKDRQINTTKFSLAEEISKLFNKTGTSQLNSSRCDIFAQSIKEMYRLLEMTEYDPLPKSWLHEKPDLMAFRLAGDDNRHFCYACSVKINNLQKKTWEVARLIFERPHQRLQSGGGAKQPRICSSCASLGFASPFKVTKESIILQLEPRNSQQTRTKIQEYSRMLTSKQLNFMAGKYVVLTADKTNKSDSASTKLGQIQYALAKVASIFPGEVLANFKFSLVSQGTKPIVLAPRHLIFIQGLIECYEQKIIISGQDINVTLGEAIRYVENDLPCLAEYTIVSKNSGFSANTWQMEKVHSKYYECWQNDLHNQGESMTNESDQKLTRAKLYKDVMALTGITYAFAQYLESTVKKAIEQGIKKPGDAEREVSKLIEEVDDPVAFCYYATLGDEKKTDVQAMLFLDNNNTFIYERTKILLKDIDIDINKREGKNNDKKVCLQLYAEDVIKAYTFLAENGYSNDRDWKNLTYNLKLSLYTRFPELVRKIKSNKE